MFSFDFKKRVRYGETDKMGYLYYGNYAQYYEIGRVESLRSLGLEYRTLEDEHKVMMPVASMEIKYIRPAYYDELLTIRTIIEDLPGKIIVFNMEIYNAKQELINKAVVKLVFIDMKTGKRVNTPDVIVDGLKPFLT